MLHKTIEFLHLFFVINWFAGLLYLPRIFVNCAMLEDKDVATHERLCMMGKRLYLFMTPAAVLAIVFGVLLWIGIWWGVQPAWLHAKVTLVAGLVVYHVYCGFLLRDFIAHRNRRSLAWYKVFSGVPVLVLIGVLLLVVVKPWIK